MDRTSSMEIGMENVNIIIWKNKYDPEHLNIIGNGNTNVIHFLFGPGNSCSVQLLWPKTTSEMYVAPLFDSSRILLGFFIDSYLILL